MTLSGDITYLTDIKQQYEYQINRVFALEELSKKDWNSQDDYKIIYERLIEAQSEARRIDLLRYELMK